MSGGVCRAASSEPLFKLLNFHFAQVIFSFELFDLLFYAFLLHRVGGSHFCWPLVLVSWAEVILFIFHFLLFTKSTQFTSRAGASSCSTWLVEDMGGVFRLERRQEVSELRLIFVCR